MVRNHVPTAFPIAFPSEDQQFPIQACNSSSSSSSPSSFPSLLVRLQRWAPNRGVPGTAGWILALLGSR